MSQTTVVILSGRTLFAEGVSSRLVQHRDRLSIHTVDSRHQDAFDQIVATQPEAVILDAMDPDVTLHCSLSKLLLSLPALKIIRLDPQLPQVQVVTSREHVAGDVNALVNLIEGQS